MGRGDPLRSVHRYRDDRMGLHGFVDSSFAHQRSTLGIHPLAHLKLHPASHIGSVREDPAGCGHRIPVHPFDGIRSIQIGLVGGCYIFNSTDLLDRPFRSGHLKGVQESCLNELPPGHPGYSLNDLAGGKEHQIGIAVVGSKRELGR